MIYTTSEGIPINVQHITHLERRDHPQFDSGKQVLVHLVSGLMIELTFSSSEGRQEEFQHIKFAMESQ